jgi:hypothetical protein
MTRNPQLDPANPAIWLPYRDTVVGETVDTHVAFVPAGYPLARPLLELYGEAVFDETTVLLGQMRRSGTRVNAQKLLRATRQYADEVLAGEVQEYGPAGLAANCVLVFSKVHVGHDIRNRMLDDIHGRR